MRVNQPANRREKAPQSHHRQPAPASHAKTADPRVTQTAGLDRHHDRRHSRCGDLHQQDLDQTDAGLLGVGRGALRQTTYVHGACAQADTGRRLGSFDAPRMHLTDTSTSWHFRDRLAAQCKSHRVMNEWLKADSAKRPHE